MVCCIKSVELDEDGPKHNCTCDWKGCRARYKSRGTEDGACKIICKGTMWIPYSLFAVYAKYVNTLQSICCGVKHNQGIEWLSNTLNYAYAAHFFYIATGFIMMSPMRTRIPCKAADGTNYYRASPLGLGNCTTITAATTTSAGRLLTSNEVVDQYVPLDYFDVVIWLPTYIHTWCVLSYLWCIAVTKYPIMCCFKRWVSANYFALWMVLAIMFASITLAQAIWYSNHYDTMYFWVLAANQILDITVLIPITHWSLMIAKLIKNGEGKFDKIGTPKNNVVPAEDAPEKKDDDDTGVALQTTANAGGDNV